MIRGPALNTHFNCLYGIFNLEQSSFRRKCVDTPGKQEVTMIRIDVGILKKHVFSLLKWMHNSFENICSKICLVKIKVYQKK